MNICLIRKFIIGVLFCGLYSVTIYPANKIVYMTTGSFGTTNIYTEYRKKMADKGILIYVTPSIKNLENFDLLITFNIPIHELEYLKKIPKEKLVLIVREPPSVHPWNHDPALHDYYSEIYTWNDALINNKKYFLCKYDVIKPLLSDNIDFDAKKLCTIICKNVTSTYRNELYSQRKKVIDFYETYHADEFDFFGPNWPSNIYKTYKGKVADKLSVLKKYKFYFCYENTEIIGYITEKIFDCFSAGVVPIYLGAPNIEEYIPKNCFIARRDFATDEDVYRFIKNLTKEQYYTYIKNAKNYLLHDPRAKLFSVGSMYKTFDKIIFGHNDIGLY